MRTADLIPYENNPRNNDDAVDAVAASIREFGFKVPIIVDKNNVIIAGHTRLKAAEKIGMETVPVVRADDLTEEQAKAFRLADNKTAELAGWDFAKLEVELAELDDIDMSQFGFDDIENSVKINEIVDDDIPEIEEDDPITKRGQIWKLGNHVLMCADATSVDDVTRLMNQDKADLVFTDPPYNVGIGSKNAFLNTIQIARRCTEDIENDKGMTDEEIGEKIWYPAFINMRNASSDCCSIYVTMPQGGTHMMMMMMMMKSGWQVKHELIWRKNAPTFSMGRLDYDYQHEPICYGWNITHEFYGKGEQNKSVWEFDKPRKCDLHPTMKPISLILNAIMNSSKDGDVVLDLFGGSGSTLIACEQTNRRCRMMEIDPKYCDVIIKRWETLTGNKAVISA